MYLLAGNQPILVAVRERSLRTGPLGSTGGCQSALVDKMGVSPMSYIENHPGMNKRPVDAAVLRRQSRSIIYNLQTTWLPWSPWNINPNPQFSNAHLTNLYLNNFNMMEAMGLKIIASRCPGMKLPTY
jgi:hypothetical protein